VASSWRYFGCAVGFGFGVVWMTVGVGSAILVLLCASLGYGVAFVAEHERADWRKLRRPSRSPALEDEPLLGDEFELDRYERRDDELPEEESAPVGAGVDYGWPSPTP
jgi:hypothetical protein